MFSCEYCEIFKSTFFIEQIRTTASAATLDVFAKFTVIPWIDKVLS